MVSEVRSSRRVRGLDRGARGGRSANSADHDGWEIIHAVLLTKTSIGHLTARGAGAEARRVLHTEFAGSSGARLGNMVRDVVCPREHWLAGRRCGPRTTRLQSTRKWWLSLRGTPHQSWKGVATTTSAAREACGRSELGGTRGQNSCEEAGF